DDALDRVPAFGVDAPLPASSFSGFDVSGSGGTGGISPCTGFELTFSTEPVVTADCRDSCDETDVGRLAGF
ncbi:hypothetical protein L9G16_20155, partial [Shewanella sp. A25]|nr:hypothetical protein [Shewanella shenzhenensis]